MTLGINGVAMGGKALDLSATSDTVSQDRASCVADKENETQRCQRTQC